MAEPTSFKDLPAELRIKIYEFAFPDPRHIDIGPSRQVNTIPITLHLNGESRHETKKHYRIIFQKYTKKNNVVRKGLLCFNPTRDTGFTTMCADIPSPVVPQPLELVISFHLFSGSQQQQQLPEPVPAAQPTEYVYPNQLTEWMDSGDLSTITHLEIKDVQFHDFQRVLRPHHGHHGRHQNPLPGLPLNTRAAFFTGLKKLRVTLGNVDKDKKKAFRKLWFSSGADSWLHCVTFGFMDSMGWEGFEERDEALRAVFGVDVDKYEGGEAPEILLKEGVVGGGDLWVKGGEEVDGAEG